MTDREQIESWAQLGESETLEFKATTGERRAAMHALCAMLNHRGGRVLFGVKPDGKVAGQQVTDKTIEDLAAEIRELDPPAFPTIDRVPVGTGREVLVVTVMQGAARPYSHRGTSYRRVGNTSPPLSRDEYNNMLLERLHGEQRWETQPVDGWSVTDLDAPEIVRTVDEAVRRGRVEEPGTRDVEALLRGLGLIRDGVLLRAAVVLFGRAERIEHKLTQCLLRIGHFRGTDRTEFLDNRQVHGNIFDLISQAERFLRGTLPIAGRVQAGLFERQDDPLYPHWLCERRLPMPSAIVTTALEAALSQWPSTMIVSK